jgi:hypothetical protein
MYIVLLAESPRKHPVRMGNCLHEKSREQEVPNIEKDGLADFRFSRDLIQWLKDASFGPS